MRRHRGPAAGFELAPDAAPSPPAPLPRCAGERGEFDPASDGFRVTASPLREAASAQEGAIRRFRTFGSDPPHPLCG
jgi:hypothetical protein